MAGPSCWEELPVELWDRVLATVEAAQERRAMIVALSGCSKALHVALRPALAEALLDCGCEALNGHTVNYTDYEAIKALLLASGDGRAPAQAESQPRSPPGGWRPAPPTRTLAAPAAR